MRVCAVLRVIGDGLQVHILRSLRQLPLASPREGAARPLFHSECPSKTAQSRKSLFSVVQPTSTWLRSRVSSLSGSSQPASLPRGDNTRPAGRLLRGDYGRPAGSLPRDGSGRPAASLPRGRPTATARPDERPDESPEGDCAERTLRRASSSLSRLLFLSPALLPPPPLWGFLAVPWGLPKFLIPFCSVTMYRVCIVDQRSRGGLHPSAKWGSPMEERMLLVGSRHGRRQTHLCRGEEC